MENLKVEAASNAIARASTIMSSPKQIATVMVGTKRAVWFQSLFPGPAPISPDRGIGIAALIVAQSSWQKSTLW
jgi:hypothetical protein